MPVIQLVRHAKPSAGWGQDPDPGLDPQGMQQAQATAAQLASQGRSLMLYSSPLRRCRETASPLERLWDRPAEVFTAVAEIPSPPLDLAARHQWLTAAMQGTWLQLQRSAPAGSPDFLAWRTQLLSALRELRHDAVIFTHFIAINVVVAAARGSDQVVCFRPDHASITTVRISADELAVLETGREADTTVLPR